MDAATQYLERIQELEVHDARSLHFLESRNTDRNLLPNLRVLKWNTRREDTIKYIRPLLCPSLDILDVTSDEEDEMALPSLFRTCSSDSPNLTSIRFKNHGQYNEELKDSLSRALCGFKNLKCLTLNVGVGNDALQHLLMSPKLEELGLVTDQDQLVEFSPPPSDIPLRNAKQLDLSLSDLDPVVELLRPRDQKLCEVVLQLRNLELPHAIRSLFNGLASQTRESPLELFRIDSPDLHPRKHDKFYVLTFDTFRPLASLGNLHELSIQLENPISLDDEELAQVARGWPLLQVFELCCIRCWPAKRITFKGLLLLAAACPKLRHVALALDAREVPTEIPVPVGSQFKSITTMKFPNSPVDNPGAVAVFLFTYFPSLTPAGESKRHRWEQALEDDPVGDREKWLDVWEFLEDEKSWADG